MTRFEYERKFESYPDLLTLEQFRAMLGGIADGTARRLMRENRVEHFMVNTTYYICSQHYRFYRRKLKHRIK